MKQFDLKKQLDAQFDEYMYFKDYNDTLGAFFRLSQIYNCIPRLEKKEQSRWLKIVRKETLNQEQIQLIKTNLEGHVEHMERLLSAFSDWIFEDIVLLLTIRIYMDLATDLLKEFGYLNEEFDLKDIDENIQDISKTKSGKSEFISAVKSIRRNQPLPINNTWLSV